MLLRQLTIGLMAATLILACDTAVEDDITQSTHALKASPPDVSCTFKHGWGRKKCDGKTKYTTWYKGPDQPILIKAKNIVEAKEKCAAWALKHSKPVWGKPKASCPKCPDGSKGCDVQGKAIGSGNVSSAGGGTYKCKGSKLKIQYTCSVCSLDAALCGEVITDVLEKKALSLSRNEADEREGLETQADDDAKAAKGDAKDL